MARTKPAARSMVTRSSRTMTRARAAKRKEQNAAAAFLDTTRETKQKSKPPPSRKKAPKKKPTQPKPKLYAVGKKIRVWWPPTRNRKRTDYSGAYWPARVVDVFEGGYRVEYDNLEREDVDGEDVSPATPPVAFGEETTSLAEREFCEVFNDSETDPAAWLAQIFKVEGDTYTIQFPFHDSEHETVPSSRVRRARIFDEASRAWRVIKPGQEWEDGEVASPNELELIDEVTLPSAVASLKDVPVDTTSRLTSDGRKYRDLNSLMNGGAKLEATSNSVSAPTHSPPPIAPSRSRSKRKDPNAPKKPRTAYVFFMEQSRQSVKDENPDMRPQQIMKLVGQNWAKLSSEEKEPYEEMSKADRQRYLEDMKSYTPPDMPFEEPGAKRARTDRDRPRKPLSAFSLFSKELRQQLGPELTSVEKTKKISETWREMTDEQKGSYKEAAKEEKERYDKELAEMEAEDAEQSKAPPATALRSIADVTAIGFQPRPLTRNGPPSSALDEDSRKTLEAFDLHQMREVILESFVDEAYYLLLDVWREGSERVGDAIRAYKTHIAGHEQPDWRAFFTSIVGAESTQALLRSPYEETEKAPAGEGVQEEGDTPMEDDTAAPGPSDNGL